MTNPADATPGLAAGIKPEDTINMKCRRGECDSITAVIVRIPGQEHLRMYRCIQCNHTWGLNVGGSVNL